MSQSMKKSFFREMQNLDAAGLLKSETPVVSSDNMEVRFKDNRRVLNFIGNDLLGWSLNAVIREVAAQTLSKYGNGSTSSRMSIGSTDLVKTLQDKLCQFFELEDCIIFPSIYLANIGLFEAMTNDRDSIFIDEMSNPGLFDGTRLSSATITPYKHRDDDNLEYHLKCSQSSRFRIIASDAVFNSNGYCANLAKIMELKSTYDAVTVIDDSLGVGILGRKGKGSLNYLNIKDKPDLVSGSFSYALGNVSGGFVGGDKDLVKWLRNTSRSYIVSEPISPVNTAIVLKAIEILEQDDTVLARLYENASYAKTKMIKKAWIPTHNDYPFISIKVGSTLKTQKIVEYLFENNILISGLCYPNTPEGAALLRINISARHTQFQIDTLVDALDDAFANPKLD